MAKHQLRHRPMRWMMYGSMPATRCAVAPPLRSEWVCTFLVDSPEETIARWNAVINLDRAALTSLPGELVVLVVKSNKCRRTPYPVPWLSIDIQ